MPDRPNNQDADTTGSGHLSEDELSEYISGDISDLDDLRRLQAHLETCSSCRERLSELRAVVWLLRGAENPVPSRSFRLDSSMVSAPVVRIDPWIVRVQPALRRLTAIAAAFLLFLVVADVLAHQNAHQVGTRSEAFSAATQSTSGSAAMSAAAPALSVATNGSSDAHPASATPVSGVAAAAVDAATTEAGTPVTSAGEAPVATSGQQEVTLSPPPSAVKSSSTSYWRLVELAVGVVVTWLLFLTFALPKLVHQREPR